LIANNPSGRGKSQKGNPQRFWGEKNRPDKFSPKKKGNKSRLTRSQQTKKNQKKNTPSKEKKHTNPERMGNISKDIRQENEFCFSPHPLNADQEKTP